MSLKETQTSLCNKALALLGEDLITDIDDKTTKAARTCKQFFQLSLRTVLSEGKWPFATKEAEAELVENLDAYAKEQQYIYAIPCDCALIVRVYTRDNRKNLNKNLDWDIRYIPEMQDSAIICNFMTRTDSEIKEPIDQDEQVIIEYISDKVCTAAYSTSFIRCLVAQLAFDMCMPITHDQQRFGNMMQYLAQVKSQSLQQALNEDGQDKMHWIDPITRSRGW